MACIRANSLIQALERAQGYLKLPNGRALTGQSRDYKRHGTTTLFAALDRQAVVQDHRARSRSPRDPQAWLADVLARLPDYPANQVADLLPWNWKANQTSKAAVAA